MRQTCPNCGADYDIPEGMVPAAGRHVQCSACHTRWFVRGTARAATSEEQILTRLESWRPRPVTVAEPGGPGEPVATAPAPRPRLVEPLRVVEAAPAAEETDAEATPAPPPLPAPPRQREVPAKPADRPTVARPAIVPDLPPPPAAPRPAPRLDLDAERDVRAPEPVPAPRSRFAHGLVLVVALALAAFGVYRYRDAVAASVPAAEPALDTYATTIDGWRDEIEKLIAPYRPANAG